MNALTWGFLTVLVLSAIASGLWLFAQGRRSGARQQKEKDREDDIDYMAENAPAWYDGRIGTDALPMREPWTGSKSTTSNSPARMERGNGDGSKRRKQRGEMHDQ